MKLDTVLKVVAIFFFLSLIVLAGIYGFDGLSGWKCTEKGCEKVLGGDHKTQKACSTSCKSTLAQAAPAPPTPPQRFSCDAHTKTCIPSPEGLYNNMGSCLNDCPPPQPDPVPVEVVAPYYPQSLYNYWNYNPLNDPLYCSVNPRICYPDMYRRPHHRKHHHVEPEPEPTPP